MDRRGRAARAATTARHGCVDVVGVRRIDHDPRRRDAAEVVARDVRPGVAAVGRLQDAVAEVRVSRERALAGAGVDHRVVRGCDRQCADRLRLLVTRLRHPRAGRRVEDPDAALRGAEDELPRRRPDDDRPDAAAHVPERARGAEHLLDRVGPSLAPRAGEGRRAGRRNALLAQAGRGARGLGAKRAGLLKIERDSPAVRRLMNARSDSFRYSSFSTSDRGGVPPWSTGVSPSLLTGPAPPTAIVAAVTTPTAMTPAAVSQRKNAFGILCLSPRLWTRIEDSIF